MIMERIIGTCQREIKHRRYGSVRRRITSKTSKDSIVNEN